MKDPTRLAAIKALRPTRALWEESCSDIIVTGRGVIAQIPSPRGGGVVERADNRKLILFSADPDYGLQALAAEIERLQEREKPVKVTETLPWVGGMSSIHEGCHVFSYAGLRPSYCPNCGRKLEWS